MFCQNEICLQNKKYIHVRTHTHTKQIKLLSTRYLSDESISFMDLSQVFTNKFLNLAQFSVFILQPEPNLSMFPGLICRS